jgi:hypothetical protein
VIVMMRPAASSRMHLGTDLLGRQPAFRLSLQEQAHQVVSRPIGSQSEAGCRFVERLLTVVQTRRLQGRPVLDYLHEALVAHRANLPAPQLLLIN